MHYYLANQTEYTVQGDHTLPNVTVIIVTKRHDIATQYRSELKCDHMSTLTQEHLNIFDFGSDGPHSLLH